MPERHIAADCPKYFDTEYVIRTDSDGDWVMHESGERTNAEGDPKQYALIKYCPFCGKNLKEEE